MEIKLNKTLLLLFCLIISVFAVQYDLRPGVPLTIEKQDNDESFEIKLSESLIGYKNYFNIKLNTTEDDKPNPQVLVGTDENCDNRLYVGSQLFDIMYIFITKAQISGSFYICIRNTPNGQKYEIEIQDSETVDIPLNGQTSYFIPDENMENVKFSFSGYVSYLDEITFWAKGKSVKSISTSDGNFQEKKFEGGIVLYGASSGESFTIDVESSTGDYVTVGSTIASGKEKVTLRENWNEIMVASTQKEGNNGKICLEIQYYLHINYITGRLYTIEANSYFADLNYNKLKVGGEFAEEKIYDGIISQLNLIGYAQNDMNEGYFCFEFEDTIIFSIRITKNSNQQYMVNTPLLPGRIERHFLLKGEWTIFYGMKPTDEAQELNLNLKSINGFPEMYYDECETFPFCSYTLEQIKELPNPYPSNRVSVYSTYIKDKEEYKNSSPVSKFMPLMIVYCSEIENSDNIEDTYCLFETTTFTDKDTINLMNDNIFSQFLLIGEKDNYKMTFHEELRDNIKRINIDMMLFSGDADIVLHGADADYNADKYYLSNKILYELTITNKDLVNFEFEVFANSNCFYNVQYRIVWENDQEAYPDEMTIESGINYITTKDRTDSEKENHLYLRNLKFIFGDPYLATFYSPNCKIDVFWRYDTETNEDIPISAYDNYAQYIINKTKDNDTYYEKKEYEFYYTLRDPDESESPSKYCIVNVAGLELSTGSFNGRAISLSEGVPHMYTYTNDHPLMYYAYHVSRQQQTLVINFNLIDKTYFLIDILINGVNSIRTQQIYRNSQLYINESDFKGNCPDNEEVCTVIVMVQMLDSPLEKRVEVTMYQMDGLPFYLEKNVVRDDVIHGNFSKHYYFDIVKGEYGDITLDFKRGSGYIYASVQKRNLEQSMDHPEWRNFYHFPTTIDESLKFRTYGKKIEIFDKDTEDCDEGCYVLITIISNLDLPATEYIEEIPFRISINPRIMKTGSNVESPKVKISVNEFIIGDIIFGLSEKRKYDYYSVNLTFESDYVMFDFQADSPNLLVNVGEERPTLEIADFPFPPIGHDYVYKIKKSEILEKPGANNATSLKGVVLTIGIYAEVADSIQSSPYAFKIFMPPSPKLEEDLKSEIIHIRSDQKVQCLATQREDKGLCIFAVIFDDMDIERNLILYPRSQYGYPMTIYGNFVESPPVERNEVTTVMNFVNEIYENNNYKEEKAYIYKEKIDKNKAYLFLTVLPKGVGGIVEVLSSTYSFENNSRVFPNPSTAQIFALGNHQIFLNFITSQDLLLNIVSLSGEGNFYWSIEYNPDKEYYLSGLNDRLSLTTYIDDKNQVPSLKVDSTTPKETQPEGFVFYITYYPRSDIDQLMEGRSTEIHYRTVMLPLYFFAKINDFQSWSINFNIYDMSLDNNYDVYYDKNIFKILATVITEKQSVQTRFDPNFKPAFNDENSVKGVFDIAFGTLFFSVQDIKKIYTGSEKDIPCLFLSFEKSNNDIASFTTFGLEVSIYNEYKSSGESSIPQNVYLNGKLSVIENKRLVYLLELNKETPYLRVEYAANSDSINFALSSDAQSEENDNFNDIEEKEEFGRKVITVKLDDSFFDSQKSLYFIIFANDNINSKLDYFVFKYITAKDKSDFKEYFDKDSSKITVDEVEKNKYQVSFNPIKVEDVDVTYYIKAVYTNDVIKGEKKSIAMTESYGSNLIISKPDLKNEQLSYDIDVTDEVSYIRVMARVNFHSEKYFYLYDVYTIKEEGNDTLDKTEKLQQIPYDFNQGYVTRSINDALKVQKYELTFGQSLKGKLQSTELPNYIKVEVTPKEGINSPILYFSPTDENGNDDRIQLSKGNSISNEMWIKREQFQGNNFYVNVQCEDENNCGYTLTFSGKESVIFETMKTYNYYVSDFNTDMTFKFRNEFESSKDIITVYATGGKEIQLQFDNYPDKQAIQFPEGAAITMALDKKHEYFNITIIAQVGDYITVGAKIITPSGKSAGNALSPDMGQINGFLEKDVISKECYSLPEEEDIFYITGTIYNSFAQVSYLDEDDQIINDETKIVRKGFFSSIYNYTETNKKYLCIGFMESDILPQESFSYSIQIQSKNKFMNDLYPPQFTGYIYPRIIPSGSLVMFNNLLPKKESTDMVYNMITTEGYPKMFLYDCENYPNCDIDYDNLETHPKVKRIAEINRMSSFTIPLSQVGKSPIDPHQQLLVVKCIKPNYDDYDHCEFMTSIFGDQEDVILVEGQPFSQYILNGTQDHFLVDFSLEKQNTLKIHLDFLVISGDVSFDILNYENENEKIDCHKYFLANKIFYSITKNEQNNTDLKKIKIKINARIPSYYIIEYDVIRSSDDEMMNYIYSSINYLVPIFQNETNNEGAKVIHLDRVKIIDPEALITTFYSLNCKINIEKLTDKGSEQLPSFETYAQSFDMFNPEETPYQSTYFITVADYDKFLISKQDICMVYVSSYEIYKNDSGIRKEILVSEGVPQRISFEPKLKIMRYVYPHVNREKNLTVSIHIIYTAKVKVNIFFREDEYTIAHEYSQDSVIFIENTQIQQGCRENELCTITVQVENIGEFEGKYPQIETTIKQVLNEPYYLPRGIIKNDFISGNATLFLYTDVGPDAGYITVNYHRGSGFIFARIVQIDQETVDTDHDWRNYHFPRTKNESLYYDFFNKKILFTKEDTSKCENGCYILISIRTSTFQKELQDCEIQFLNLLADFSPLTYIERNKEQNKVEIEPEEYVIGSLYKDDDKENKGLFEYYYIECPYNASAIEIDWQSNTAELYIKLDEGRPNQDDYVFRFYERKDTNIILTKQQINKKMEAQDENSSLENLRMVLGVYANVFDAINSAVYSFRIHFARPGLNIYKINSDQKTICTPEKLEDNKYRCLFMVIYQEYEYLNDLLAYAKSQSPSSILDMFGDFVDNEFFNVYDVKKLQGLIPGENAEYSTKKEKTKYIYFDWSEFHKDAFISVISDTPDPIEFFTSMKASEETLSPNPSSLQVYFMDINQEVLNLDFITSRSISVKITSLNGEAKISEEKDAQSSFYLRGIEDSFNLIFPGKIDTHDMLFIKNLRYQKQEYKQPGFAFILEFNLRGELNLDELQMDDTSEMIYNRIDLPAYYYVKINDTNKDINAFFYLHNSIYDDYKANLDRQIVSNELVFKGTVLEENKIYDIKRNKDEKPKLDDLKIVGVIDPVMQIGNIIIKSDNFKDNKIENPTLYLALEKGDQGKNINYSNFRGEFGTNTINGDSPVIQKLYQFGKLTDYSTINVYKLNADFNGTNYMRVQFSTNSKYVNFAINKEPNKKENSTFDSFEAIKENGVVYVTLRKNSDKEAYLYLNVFLAQDIKDDKLKNFVFKYINAEDPSKFYIYGILDKDPKIQLEKNGNNMKVTFNSIDIQLNETSETSIFYTVKFVLSDNAVKDENANIISISESNAVARQFKHVEKKKLTFEFENAPEKFKFAQVVATITSGSIIEYVSYQAVDKDNNEIKDPDPVQPGTDPEPDPGKTDKNDGDGNIGVYVIIAVSCVLVIVVVILVVVIIRYNSKNKDLLNQVNKISFTESGASGKDDANLLMDNQNELD